MLEHWFVRDHRLAYGQLTQVWAEWVQLGQVNCTVPACITAKIFQMYNSLQQMQFATQRNTLNFSGFVLRLVENNCRTGPFPHLVMTERTSMRMCGVKGDCRYRQDRIHFVQNCKLSNAPGSVETWTAAPGGCTCVWRG